MNQDNNKLTAKETQQEHEAALGGTAGSPLLRGRFKGGVHPALHAINRSFAFDQRMWKADIAGSVAHAVMLGSTGILSAVSVDNIVAGLRQVEAEFESGLFQDRPEDEDIHMAVERRLTELIGEDGRRLHTARSRNDQVATDLRLYLVGAGARLQSAVVDVQRALVSLASEEGQALLPFYTHLQRAQPVLLGHVLLAYVEMLEQDRRGLESLPRECPLGAGAGTGTTFAIDRALTARELGFAGPSPNSLEAVSSRRDATVFAASMACCATTLSRLGADIVLWCSREFGFARLGDSVSTGSSIMPQKRNPDGAELLRAKAITVSNAVSNLLELQRGLPIGYSKDLQEDKPVLFGAEDTLGEMLAVAEAMLGELTFDTAAMRAAVDDPAGYLLATEAADWLVRKGCSFRSAHEAVGAMVKLAEARGVDLLELTDEELSQCHGAFDASVREVLTPEAAVAARSAVGGTAPKNVAAQIAAWSARLR
ncbi:MAG: argininosuccinate lyase [Pseudohongiellaceae bacterium]|jgi:argininosuccinate lyase